jgi:HSP20 family protein
MSFFDKLKKGVEPPQEPFSAPTSAKASVGKKAREKPKKIKVEKLEEKLEEKLTPPSEGELAVDVYETNENFVIQSTLAGVKAEDLDIAIENDLVTISGSRQRPDEEGEKKYFYQECYWGPFSRKIILPEEVDDVRIRAKIKNGILTLKLPKLHRKKRKKITVEIEE